MCGIFGFWSWGAGLSGEFLKRATRLVAHRGPDGRDYVGWIGAGGAISAEELDAQSLTGGLGHCRLAILDLSPAGRQPMEGPDGVWVSFNGEIYNYRDLQGELELLGFRFRTRTDTEVLLAAYAAWGERCVERFNGMWAFVLYDPRRRRLLASRDRLGVKPLYYVRTPTVMAFASEIAPLLACPGVSRDIVPERLAAYLVDRRIDHEDATIYRDVRQLRGANNLVLDVDTGAYEIRSYWRLPSAPDFDLSDRAALDRFSELLEDSVRLRLHADVPVAITLSGGVDSSAITVAASRVAAGEVHTFTSRFPGGGRIDEAEFATAVARASGVSSHFIEPSTISVVEDEPDLTRHQELPYASLSLYVHWAILRSIRSKHVPVVISGQGGDELFLGYERFYGTATFEAFPDLLRWARIVRDGVRHSALDLSRMLANIGYFSFPRLQRRIRARRLTGLVNPAYLRTEGPAQPDVVGNRRRQQELDLTSLSLPALLRYDDRTAGALGMETRLPFLDFRMVEFAFRLPMRFKIRDGWTKYLVRKYLERHGLASTAWRRGKVAFEAPQAEWTRALVGARGEALRTSRFGVEFLATAQPLDRVPPRAAWDLYNCLHLAKLMSWQTPEGSGGYDYAESTGTESQPALVSGGR